MAGFRTGLVHGTLMCGVTLAALSLAFPRDSDDRRRAGEVASDTGAVVGGTGPAGSFGANLPDDVGSPVSPPSAVAAQPLLAPSGGDAPLVTVSESPAYEAPASVAPSPLSSSGPAVDAAPGSTAEDARGGPAEQLPDPVGSDFRRGSDDPPRVPEVSSAPVDRHVPRGVSASPESAAPVAPALNEVPPPVSAAPPAPGPLSPQALAPEPLVAPSAELPVAVATPGRVAAPGLDRVPEPAHPAAAEADLAETEAMASQEQAAPASAGSDRAPRPAPDLSIPRALFPAGAGRAPPALPQPTAAMPAAPDLSDLNPGAMR